MLPPKEIFKAYDIRGIVGKTLTAEIVETIGLSIGSEAIEMGQTHIAIGRDGRLSGPDFLAALARGLQRTGIHVIDIGLIATPMAYFAAYHLHTNNCVMITGSHNPPEYNGLKVVIANEALSGSRIKQLYQRIIENRLRKSPAKSLGSYQQLDIGDAYIERIRSDIKLARPMHIAVDCGNGAAGAYAARLYRAIGCTVQELYCDVDGHFPNHHPDPAQPENLQDLIQASQHCELGLAFDGDGDRLGVVTQDGHIIYSDRQLMLFADDLLTRHPGTEIIFDIKSSGQLFPWIQQRGGKATIWKTGHSLIKAKMRETGAMLAGEMTGHIFLTERWYGFDDGLYAGARLLEILSHHDNPSAVLNALPNSMNTPEIHILMSEGANHNLIAQLQSQARFPLAHSITTLDGLRVEYPYGFGLIRASNTTPAIVLRFEADTPQHLQDIQREFRELLQQFAPELNITL